MTVFSVLPGLICLMIMLLAHSLVCVGSLVKENKHLIRLRHMLESSVVNEVQNGKKTFLSD